MRIGYSCQLLRSHRFGVGNCIQQLALALARTRDQAEVVFYVHDPLGEAGEDPGAPAKGGCLRTFVIVAMVLTGVSLLGMAGLTAFAPWPCNLARAQSAAPYTGPLFITVAAGGGWDPTSFCDPKVNTPGEEIINHWADTSDVQQAGNIAYAPFAANQAFFEWKKHKKKPLIFSDQRTGN